MPHPLLRLLQWVFMPRARKPKASTLYAFSDDDDDNNTQSGELSNKTRNVRHTHTDWSQRDGRRSVHTSYYDLPASPTKHLRRSTSLPFIAPIDDSVLYDSSADPLDMGYILDMPESDLAPAKEPNERPLLRFVKEADTYLSELLWLEGRGPYTEVVCVCGREGSLFRCEDCRDLRLFCALCTVNAHASLPLHRLKVWTGTHFAKTSLKNLGLRVQLGHVPGQACFNAKTAWGNDFVLLDHTGVHELNLDFCGCEQALPHYQQLLRERWFPATSTQPKTAATFSLLESYHLLSAQAKISSYQFVTALERRTDNTGSEAVKDRYVAFMRMMREWSHLKMMKRAGRGNDPGGIASTPPGACAIECPACPHPGKNVPLSVEDVPENKRWLRRLFLAIDANFKLKRKKVSSEAVDPSLNRGYAYVVEEFAYKTHLARHDKQPVDAPSKHCNNHDAVRLATSKNAAGLSSTGVVCVDCSRHEFKRPLSTGDIQKGERQVNTDYILNSSLTQGDSQCEGVFVTYDIACNYATHVHERFQRYGFQALPGDFGWAIPKFHINAHQEWCRANLNTGYIVGCARCDGEGIERNWSEHIGAGQSTIEMGPGARRDALDNIFAHHNWGKVRKLPYVLVKRLIKAVVERDVQTVSFAQYRDALPAASVQQWTTMVEAWEVDRENQPNPFFISRPAITQGTIRRQLMEEDDAALRAGTAVVLHERCSASAMLINGIELEDLQRRLRTDIAQLHQHATDRERASVQDRSNAVRRRIEVWAAIQQLYLPAVVALRQRLTSQDDKCLLTHNLPLLLPSALVAHMPVAQSYLEQEWRLRYAQAFDALADLRGRLEVRTHLYKTKDRFVRGQRANTRAQTVIKNVNNRIAAEAERYRAAFGALEVLENHVAQPGWRANLRTLLDADIRHLTDGEHGQTEGRRTRSWIWEASASPGGLCGNDGYSSGSGVHESLHESLRVEFCKGRARAQRWEEEVERLVSEMFQTLAYHDWDAARWHSRIDQAHLDLPEYREGANAYAYRQAAVRVSLRDKCRLLWSQELTAASLPRKRNIASSFLSSAPASTLFTLANFASLFSNQSNDPDSDTCPDSFSTLATIASSSLTADSVPAAIRDSGVIDPTLSSYEIHSSLSEYAQTSGGAV